MSVEALSPGMIPSLKNAWRAVARTCPVTGLVINRDSDRLVRWNARGRRSSSCWSARSPRSSSR